MTAFGVLARRGPSRFLFALAALVLTVLGGAVAVPLAAANPALRLAAPQQITWDSLQPDTPLTAGVVSVSATADSGLTVGYASTTTGVCTTDDGDAVVTLLAKGTCTIEATQPGNGSFAAAAPVRDSFEVFGAAQTIIFSPTADHAVTDGPVRVAAVASSTLPVRFSTATAAVCTVAGTTVTLIAGGTCTIRADQAGDDRFAAAPRVADSFAVARSGQTITFTGPADRAMARGTVPVTATATSGLAVRFTSATTAVCTVAGGKVTLVGVGTCGLRADQPGNGRFTPAPQVRRTFTVSRGAQAVAFTPPPATALGAGTVTVAATATSGRPVTFTSTTTGVCTVTGDRVTLLAAGACTIRATRPGDADYAAAAPVDGTFTVTPAAPVPPATTAPPATPAPPVASVPPVAPGTPAASGTSGTPGGPGVAAVDAAQSITFAQPATRGFADGPLTVAPTASSGLPVALSSATTAVCTVAGFVVTPVTAGDCVLHADQGGATGWLAAVPVDRTVTITPAAQTIAFTAPAAAAVSAGPVPLTGTATSGLTVTFATTSSGICTVEGTTVTPVAVGACVLTAAQAGDNRYAVAPVVTATLTVLQDPAPVTVPAAAPPAADAPLTSTAGSSTAPGATITVSGSGYRAATSITVVMYSTPVALGTTVTDSAGAFELQVTVPVELSAGGHTLVAAGLGTDNAVRYLTVPVAVAAGGTDTLPLTGGPVGAVTALGAWAVLIGTVLTLLGRPGWQPRRSRWAYRARHAVAV